MDSHVPAERIFIVVGAVAGLVVTVLAVAGSAAINDAEAAIGVGLCWVALVVFIAMARFLDRSSGGFL